MDADIWLVYTFLELPRVHRMEILREMNLLEADDDLNDENTLYASCFSRAKTRNMLDEFEKRINEWQEV